MKKLISTILALTMSLTMLSMVSFAADTTTPPQTVTMTIVNEKGELAVTAKDMAVTDMDDDGKLTINDAFISVHKSYNKEYVTEMGDYGLFITTFWGVTNGGSYGYYHNDKMVMSLTEEIKNGDKITGYVIRDTVSFSDTYCFFTNNETEKNSGDEIVLTLKKVAFDAMYNPVEMPLEGAEITVNGEKTGVKTDAEGKATIKLQGNGEEIISAVSDTVTLVPPVLKVNVLGAETTTETTTNVPETTTEATTETQETTTETTIDKNEEIPKTDSENGVSTVIAMGVTAIGILAAFAVTKKKKNEE